MEHSFSEALHETYRPVDPTLWDGRSGGNAERPQYWHEAIRPVNLLSPYRDSPYDIGLLGYASDEGVLRNQGRIGAAEGPDALRETLGRLAFHRPDLRVADFGTVDGHGESMETAQEALTEAVAHLVQNGIFPIVIGGGHDLAFGHVKGLLKGREGTLGIINLDAHLDLRAPAPETNSGTPFHQLLTEHGSRLGYLALGIQRESNPPELLERARDWGVEVVMIEDCQLNAADTAIYAIEERFGPHYDGLYLTIDLDGFSSAYAPGVSAPSPLGFDPTFAGAVIDTLLRSGKLVGMDIAELNPKFDRDRQTAQLAARLLGRFVQGWMIQS